MLAARRSWRAGHRVTAALIMHAPREYTTTKPDSLWPESNAASDLDVPSYRLVPIPPHRLLDCVARPTCPWDGMNFG